MSLKKRIMLFTIAFLFLISTGITVTLMTHNFIHRFNEEVAANLMLQTAFNNVRYDFDHALMASHDYMVHGRLEEKEIFSNLFHNVKQKIQGIEQLLVSYTQGYDTEKFNTLAESHQRLGVIEKGLPKLEQMVLDIFATQQPLGNPAGGKLMEKMDLFVLELDDIIAQESTFFDDRLEQHFNALHEREHRLYVLSMLMGSFAILAALLLSFYFYRTLTMPLNHLLLVTRKISAGDVSVKVELDTDDEFGELAHSFNHMLQQLAITNDRLNSIFQGSGDAMRIIDDNFTVLQVNNEMAGLCGIPVAMNKGMKCYDQFPSEHCHTETCTLRQMLGGKKRLNSETIKQTTAGKMIPVEMIVTPLLIEGKIAGIIESFRDITERKKAEKEKEQMNTRLLHAQKLESVGQLAAGIAHEINTPTQYVSTNIDFMDEAAKDITVFMEQIQQIADSAPQEIRDRIRHALEEADWEYLAEELPQAISQSRDGVKRVSSIVLAMKEFSHPGSKVKEPQNLNQIINTTVTVARNEWKYIAEMKLDLDPALPNVPLLVDEMGQVILNILVNAAHAIGEKLGDNSNAEKGTITIRTKQLDRWIELRISDTGNGITEIARPRIFDPFYTTKKVGKGTGQGLAISRDVIVEKHGGSIDFTTETDKGTEFIIQLPLQNGESL